MVSAAKTIPSIAIDVDVWDGHIFINLSGDHDPLAAQLEDLPHKFQNWRMAELRSYRQIEYEVKANWKLIMLNYNECLHCPILHPALNAISDYLSGENDPPQRGYIGGSMEFQGGAKTMSTDGKLRRDYLPGLSASERRKVYYYAIFPNLLLSLHPDYVMTHTLWPRAVDRTDVICEWHFHPDEMASLTSRPTTQLSSGTAPTAKIGRSRSFRRPESSRAPINPVLTPAVSRCPTHSTRWCWTAKGRH